MSLILGDCVEQMAAMPEACIDAIVTDPPYGLEFMGKDWDKFAPDKPRLRSGWKRPADTTSWSEERREGWYATGEGAAIPAFHKRRSTWLCGGCGKRDAFRNAHSCGDQWAHEWVDDKPLESLGFQAWCEEWAREALRVLKPGGHLLAFGGTRTHHRLMVAIEDAGFEVRDTLCWLYGSGFPKSLDVGKALDKAAGAKREVVGLRGGGSSGSDGGVLNMNSRDTDHGSARVDRSVAVDVAATDAAREWDGWGTALKPAWEPIVMARRPLVGTVAQNVTEHGTGALNIDGTRIGTADDLNGGAYAEGRRPRAMAPGGDARSAVTGDYEQPTGRWPANLVLDEEAAMLLDAQAGDSAHSFRTSRDHQGGLLGWQAGNGVGYADGGGPSRFFYTAKASRSEREAGLLGYRPCTTCGSWLSEIHETKGRSVKCRRNSHPTVKPLALMRWLVRMVTPLGGRVLDPFLGSGTTGVAATLEGFDLTGIEQDPDSLAIARLRIAHAASPA